MSYRTAHAREGLWVRGISRKPCVYVCVHGACAACTHVCYIHTCSKAQDVLRQSVSRVWSHPLVVFSNVGVTDVTSHRLVEVCA